MMRFKRQDFTMAKAQGKQYGKDSTPNPAVSKYARLAEGNGASTVSWEEVDGRLIKAAIVATSEDGCALIFGKTSDGGALSFTLLGPGQPVKRWFKSAELAESFLHEVIATTSA
jgi:hypothetical protein